MGKKDESAPTQVAAPTPNTIQSAEAAPEKSSNGMPERETIYAGIQKYMSEHHGRAAKGIEELVAGHYIPALPSPPPGKKYELDQRFATLTVVDK
jgi:hypothetical protein